MAILRFASTTRNTMLSDLNTAIGTSATIDIYSGTIPANVDTAASGTLLATLTGSATAFGTVAGGSAGVNWVLTANAITSGTGTAGAGTGTAATWCRISTSGAVAIVDCDVGASGSGATLILDNTSIATGQTVSITSLTITGANAV